jgi:hypothetical protein
MTFLFDLLGRLEINHQFLDNATQAEEDPKLKRAQRFGIVTPVEAEDKKKQRAKRFNIVNEKEVKQKRAERFATGKGKSSPATENADTRAEVRKERAQRFAATKGSSSTGKKVTHNLADSFSVSFKRRIEEKTSSQIWSSN